MNKKKFKQIDFFNNLQIDIEKLELVVAIKQQIS